jgi:hypothetical protein
MRGISRLRVPYLHCVAYVIVTYRTILRWQEQE